ncbi:thiamine pyrophosphate-binding protein [Halorubellus litoreus]|uniref:Thiamine pyrophosphate-binding protein n=1 Tax=Halorubellus litoreus TaxID=755308 RepID=A0ABD5VGT9_9EURY
MHVADGIGEYLHTQGVDTVFTLLSEDVMDITSGIQATYDDVEVVECRHEQLAIAMADGYAQTTNEVAVAVVGRGPALAQTGTALVTAAKQDSPLLVVTAETPTTATSDLKGFSQQSFLEATVGDARSVRDTDAVVETLDDAFHDLRAGHGPIAVQIAWDVIEATVGHGDWPTTPAPGERERTAAPPLAPDPGHVDALVDAYLDSGATNPPTILAGRGAYTANAVDAIETLAERMGAIIATTLRGQGPFDDHPYAPGFVGNIGAPLANELVVESDFVLAVGASLTDYTTDDGHVFADDATIAHIDADPSHIGKHTPVDVAIPGDARLTVDRFETALAELDVDFSETFWTQNLRRRIADAPRFPDRDYPQTPGRMDPRDLLPRLDDALPADRNVVVGAGHFAYWVFDGITVPDPDSLVWPIQFGSIGLGLPAGIGTALAATDAETTVAFCGDGGLMMSIQALETAVRHDAPLVLVAMNDDALGAEYAQLHGKGGHTDSGIVPAPDFTAVATAFGAQSHTVTTLDDLDDALDSISHRPDAPVVLDCKIDREVRHRRWD